MMSAVGGFFGMNLCCPLEDHPKKFWIVTYVTLITSASLWYLRMLPLKRRSNTNKFLALLARQRSAG